MNVESIYFALEEKGLIPIANRLASNSVSLSLNFNWGMGGRYVKLIEQMQDSRNTILIINWEGPLSSRILLSTGENILSLGKAGGRFALSNKTYNFTPPAVATSDVHIHNRAASFPLVLVREGDSIVCGIMDSSGAVREHRKIFRITRGRLIFYRNIDRALGLPFVTYKGTVRYSWENTTKSRAQERDGFYRAFQEAARGFRVHIHRR